MTIYMTKRVTIPRS